MYRHEGKQRAQRRMTHMAVAILTAGHGTGADFPSNRVWQHQPSMPAASTPTRTPVTARFLLAHPAHFIALGFGVGLAPMAPGTAGTLWAWAAFIALQATLPPVALGSTIAAALGLGWWACTVTARNLATMDPGQIVWDEIVTFWIVLWLLLPAGFIAQLCAFALFRFFDAVKPGPVGWADRRFKRFGAAGGLGILLDDLVAGFLTLLVLALSRAAGW